MLHKLLENRTIILASGSPRRQQFFRELQIPFEVVLKPVDESFPDNLSTPEAIASYIAEKKNLPFTDLREQDILITGDTIVWYKGIALGKPKDEEEACAMLRQLSGTSHQVSSAVCFTTLQGSQTLCDTTTVVFRDLQEKEIRYYVEHYKPFDKAGAYGIQEWLGAVGVTTIQGSYNTVMGLPTHLVYKTLMAFATS